MENQERNYIPLTKKIILEGKPKTVCLHYDTKKCRIHKKYYKVDKRLFEALIEQLNVFEEVYTQEVSL